ncbi:heme o synthase [Reichenbachiella agarivorans]|uniref:Protoheme IX farnesyltransferase n=1 Tax=Reichenbachiella agarivorans TaxID=2979464 RepID=A0ABY6CQU3_9BACT|nr:heme o synthase [Reichenbachiella agarivorans]UXP32881.1 heme o synthase [Reichenbachiella agarivorans]
MHRGVSSQAATIGMNKVHSYVELLKPRLSFLVAFSSGFGYILASPSAVNWPILLLLSLGGFLVSGASVTINQIIEIEYDRLMDRTKNRPLPTGKITVQEAVVFSILVGVAGLSLLYFTTNILTTVLSFISFVLYSFVYTPLKRVGPIAVFVGAIPGALPPLLGWVAATGVISHEALIIFGIQFIWQFPHFWAIAWVSDKDYKKAGFKLLPNKGEKDLNTAINIMVYTLFLLPLGLLPAYFGITGINSAIVATICGAAFLAQTFSLMRDYSDKAALKIMFGSFLYLPIVQIAFLLDKI